jgi:methionyl-tRNA formyltransferase
MSEKTAVGLLTFEDSPLTMPCLLRLKEMGYSKIHLIFDGDQPWLQLMKIISERTEGQVKVFSREDYQSAGATLHSVSSHNAPECLKLVQDLNLWVLGSCGTPRKLESSLLNGLPGGVLNAHPGKLPHFRGSSTLEWALHHNESVEVTTHWMNEAYDQGSILKHFPFPTAGLTYTEIRTQISAFQGESLAWALDHVLTHKLKSTEQKPQGEGKVWSRAPSDIVEGLRLRGKFK